MLDFLDALTRWGADLFNSMFASLLTAALAGRLAWHTRLVQKGERQFFSKEMGYEAIVVVFLFYVSQSAVAALVIVAGFSPENADKLAPGIAALISYFGPGGIQAAIVAAWEKWSGKIS